MNFQLSTDPAIDLFNRSAQAAGPGCEIQATKNQPTSGLGESGSGLRGSKRGPGGVWDGSGGSGRGLGGSRRGLGGVWEGSGGVLEAPKTKTRETRTQRSVAKTTRDPLGRNFSRYGARVGGGFGVQNRSKSLPRSIPISIIFLIAFWIDFGPQNRSKKDPKIDQKSIQNRSQKEARRKHTKV